MFLNFESRGRKLAPNFGTTLGLFTKLSATPIYGKNLQTFPQNLKYFAWSIRDYKIYINDDPWLTLTYFMAGSCINMGKNVIRSFNGKKLRIDEKKKKTSRE